MSAPAIEREQHSPRRRHNAFIFNKVLLYSFLIGGGLLAVIGSIVSARWPYRHREVLPLLEDVFGYQVTMEKYHRTYFPHPGFIATGITLRSRDRPDGPPIGTIETLSVIGRWDDLLLLNRRVRLVELTRFHLMLPAPGSKSAQFAEPHGSTDGFKGPATAVEQILIHNSTLDILRKNGGHYLFAIRELRVQGVQRNNVMSYIVDMENPLPAGHISAHGTFGPLRSDDVGATPVSGQFTYNNVNLSDIGKLRGTLAASGYFQGPLRSIQADAITDTPDFAFDDGQPTPVRGFVRCTIDGLNGDVVFREMRVSTGRTLITAHGQVAGSPKITNIELSIDDGRAEEVLRPFLHKAVPIFGPITLHGSAFIAPPGQPFLQRLRFTGQFNVPADQLSDREKEESLTAFSRRIEAHQAGGDMADPQSGAEPDVLATLQGAVGIRQGVVSTSQLNFSVPGARATLHGTFNFNNSTVHLTGVLRMDATISHAATGWKSILLKPLQPFFRRKTRPGSQIPIAVTGSPGHYKVTQDLAHNK